MWFIYASETVLKKYVPKNVYFLEWKAFNKTCLIQ